MTHEKAVFLALLATVLAAAPFASAEESGSWGYQCLDDSTLFRNTTFFVNDAVYAMNQTVNCPYGCDSTTLRCSPDPYNALIWGAVPIIILLAGAAAAAYKWL